MKPLSPLALLIESWVRTGFASCCTVWAAWFLFGRIGAGIVLALIGLMFFASASLLAKENEAVKKAKGAQS